MLTCLLDGSEITYYDFVEKSDDIDNAKIQLKKYSGDNKLKCKGCGETVCFVDSEKRIKHFRHKSGSRCGYSRHAESQKSFEAVKEALYSVIKARDTLCDQTMDKCVAENIWADIYVSLKDGGATVINFIKRSYKDLLLYERHRFFKEKGIKDFWIILGEPSVMNGKIDMYTKDSLMLREDWQGAGLYCGEESDRIIVRVKNDDNTYSNEAIDIHDFTIDENGSLPIVKNIRRRYFEEQAAKPTDEFAEMRKFSRRKRIKEFYDKTGKFADGYLGGTFRAIDLEDIKVGKDKNILMAEYTEDDFNEKLEGAFAGDAQDIRALINKLYRAQNDEKEKYDKIMEKYRSLPRSDERFKILSHISIESGFNEYIKNKKQKTR